jgi:hypothetical protein
MAVHPLSREQTRMLEFASRWAPFGGGTAGDILVEFGLSEQVFYTRVSALVNARPVATGLDAATIGSIQDACRKRLRP